jgi:hypothetical protein
MSTVTQKLKLETPGVNYTLVAPFKIIFILCIPKCLGLKHIKHKKLERGKAFLGKKTEKIFLKKNKGGTLFKKKNFF